jgi:mono/diheme cytochrome c family protein
MKILKMILSAGAVVAGSAAVFIYLGIYPPGADEPHSAVFHKVLQVSRDRAIAVRADDLNVPDLSDAAMIKKGAGNYAAMCSSCHLAPGKQATELSKGLYPAPPALASGVDLNPAEAFWVIKHGIKMSAMPAWGKSMGDSYIWGLVAFLKRMPVMTPTEYREMVATSGGHSHGGGETMDETMDHDDMDMPAHDHDHAENHHRDEAAPHHHDQESPVGHSSSDPTSQPHAHKHVESASATHDTSAAALRVHAVEPAEVPMAGMDHANMAGMSGGIPVAPANLPIRNAAEATVQAFQEALQVGNRKLALRLLSPSVKILEGDETQSSRDEYAAHHLQSDMDFLKASRVIPQTRTSRIDGDTAKVSSTARIIGRSDGKPIDVINRETATLEKTTEGWRIVEIDWSSSAPQ